MENDSTYFDILHHIVRDIPKHFELLSILRHTSKKFWKHDEVPRIIILVVAPHHPKSVTKRFELVKSLRNISNHYKLRTAKNMLRNVTNHCATYFEECNINFRRTSQHECFDILRNIVQSIFVGLRNMNVSTYFETLLSQFS